MPAAQTQPVPLDTDKRLREEPLQKGFTWRLDSHIKAALKNGGRRTVETDAYYGNLLGDARVRDVLAYCRHRGVEPQIGCLQTCNDAVLTLQRAR